MINAPSAIRKGLCRSAKPLAELGGIVIFKFIPWDQLEPAVVTREFAAKRQEEVFKRELVTMLTPVHVENVGRLLGAFGPVRRHFTARNCSDPLQRN
jgi:hypothetical protein